MPPKPTPKAAPQKAATPKSTTPNSTPKPSNPTPKVPKEPKEPKEQQTLPKPEQEQKDVPPVVTAIRTKQDVTFLALPVQPSQFPKEPVRLPFSINNPTSDVIWSPVGDRCAVCTSDGIFVCDTPLTPGAEFCLNLRAILPHNTARYVQFSPLGTYLISYETYTKYCPVNLVVWDLSVWQNNTCQLKPQDDVTPDGADNVVNGVEDGDNNNGEKNGDSVIVEKSAERVEKKLYSITHESIIFKMAQRHDLPTSPHSSVQWTDDELYTFILQDVGQISCYKSKDMKKPLTTVKQKRLSLFQLSKIPKSGDLSTQHIALFSPCHADEPARCIIFKTLDIVRGQSIASGGHPPPNAPKMPPLPIVWGPLKPCQQVAIFRTNSVSMQWHMASQALLLKTSFDDGSGQSYYGETRLYVVYVDKEAVAVSFGNDSKGEIHDAAWCPTNFEFTTLHGPARDATCTIWHARDCSAVRSICSGPFNVIRYNPSGRLLLLAGLGSLSGKMEIWDKKNLVRLYRGQDEDSPRNINWSPCGRYLISATIFPYLRVGNQFKIQRFDGTVLYQEKAKQSATKLSIAPESSVITLSQQGPDNGHFLQVSPNFFPRTGIFLDVKIPQELLQSAQVKMKIEPAQAPAPSKYIPPHLRTQSNTVSSPTPSTSPQISNQDDNHNNNSKNDQNTLGFGAVPATQASQQLHKQQQQHANDQRKANAASHDVYGSWRR